MKGNHGQLGISLVELMIGMVLALSVIGGVISIFISNKQGFHIQDSASHMQESARFGMNHLSQLIRSADLWSGIDPATITMGTYLVSAPKSSKTCTGEWIINVHDGLHGYHGAATSPIDCIANADYVAQSDMLAIRRIDPNTFTPVEIIDDKDHSQRHYVRIRVGLDGYLYKGSQRSEAGSHIPDGNGVLNYEYDFQLLFLRPCSVKKGGTCGSHGTTPTLVSLQLQSDGGVSQIALIDNVEQMKFEYGVDSNNDLAVDTYRQANQITDWNKVLSVRARLIVRGSALDHFRDNQTYDLGGGFCHGPAQSSCKSKYSGFERHQRRLITRDILVRNRVRQ